MGCTQLAWSDDPSEWPGTPFLRRLRVNAKMDFRIADTFTASLAKLTGNERKAAKTTAFDLQMNPAQPGHRFHKLGRSARSEVLVCPRQP